MRRRAVSTAELSAMRASLAADFELVSYDIDAGPKMLQITAPNILHSGLQAAKQNVAEARNQSLESLHGRDGLTRAPEAATVGPPHWSELWPCSRAMAAYFGHCVRMRSVDAVEVNCGLGTAGLGAAAKLARPDAAERILDDCDALLASLRR